MCRGIWIVAACLAGVRTLPAQTVEQQAGEVARLAELDAALSAAMESDSALGLDTVPLAGARILTFPRDRRRASDAVGLASFQLEELIGSDGLRVLDGWELGFFFRAADMRRASQAGMLEISWIIERAPIELAAGQIVRAALARVGQLGGRTLQNWSTWWLLDQIDSYRREAYYELITSPSIASRRCFRGDIAWCARAHALDTVSDPIHELFDAADRHTMVAQRDFWWWRGDLEGTARRCVDERDDDACVAALTEQYATSFRVRYPRVLRDRNAATVVATSLEVGGEGSLRRLLADTTATITARLEAAAGVRRDSLLAAWLASVMDAAPPATAASGPTTWLALLVVAGFAGLALRSSRWRLG